MKTYNCMLAHPYRGDDPTGWAMSEKLDGGRGVWDGNTFVSRNDKPIYAPKWWLARLPLYFTDGEMFLGRGKFQSLMSISRKHIPIDEEWEKVKFYVIQPLNVKENDVVIPIQQTICQNPEHLEAFYRNILSIGGEGVMLRNLNRPYEFRRSWSLLKVKPELTGTAKVVGHQPGKGKHEGRLGSLICEWEGKTVEVGTGFTDEQRENPPMVGAMIPFRYQCLTNEGIPRFPVYNL